MNPYELTAIITAFAIAIAKATPDNDELAVISLAYSQLSKTLDTIIAQRVVLEDTEADLNPALTL